MPASNFSAHAMSERSGNVLSHARLDSRVPLLPLAGLHSDKSSSSSPSSPSFRRFMFPLTKRRSLVALVALASVTVLTVHLTFFARASASLDSVPHDASPPLQPHLDAHSDLIPDAPTELHTEPKPEEEEYWPISPHLKGPPAPSFRDNLRNDTKYITSWGSAGWSEYPLCISPFAHLTMSWLANDVMTYANLIYLGSLTDRVTILPMFTPSHIGGDVAPIPFGEVFDVPRFVEESGIQVVEWDEVKEPTSQVVDDLGCWNIWEAVQYREHFPRRSAVPEHLKLGTPLAIRV